MGTLHQCWLHNSQLGNADIVDQLLGHEDIDVNRAQNDRQTALMLHAHATYTSSCIVTAP